MMRLYSRILWHDIRMSGIKHGVKSAKIVKRGSPYFLNNNVNVVMKYASLHGRSVFHAV